MVVEFFDNGVDGVYLCLKSVGSIGAACMLVVAMQVGGGCTVVPRGEFWCFVLLSVFFNGPNYVH